MQTPKIINIFFFINSFLFFLTSCNTSTREKKYVPEIKGGNIEVEIIRFENEFFSIDATKIPQEIKLLREKYPEFVNGYLASVLGVRDTSMENQIIAGYLNFKDAKITYDTIQKVFNKLDQVQKEINELATYYQYYFPDAKPLTKAYTYMCEYHGDRLALPEEGFVGLPLDMSLGIGYPAYTFSKFPMYDQRTCNREHLVAKAANAVAQNIIMTSSETGGSHLIDLMIYNGKTMYLTDILIPNIADSLKFGFSSFQMEYCEKGEMALYNYLSENELFYSGDRKKISKYITKGPFKPNFDLPGNSGTWLGYRIILSYANHYRKSLKQSSPELSEQRINQQVLNRIFEEKDPQKFLLLYKPPK